MPGSLDGSYMKNLRVQLFDHGKCVYENPPIAEIRDYCMSQIDTLWDTMLRFENPQTYYVDLSQKLYALKQKLIQEHQIEDED